MNKINRDIVELLSEDELENEVTQLKLPKFTLTSFNGGPLKRTSFIETFDAAADSQESLSAIEQFLYLTGDLEGPAADCVGCFSLTSKNYIEARKLLELLISAHINVLLKLPKLNNW